jgi:hypothetical protein
MNQLGMAWLGLAMTALIATGGSSAAEMGPPGPSARAPGILRAGAAKVEITPGDFTGFYSVWAKPFEGVHDPIFARALVVTDGTNSAALVSTDLVEFGDTTSLRQRIERELGIPADHIIIAASHDHNAPRAGPIVPGTSSAQGRPYSPANYVEFVDDRIVQTLGKAKAALQPARVGVGSGRADINVNRNGYNGKGWGGADPDGPSDKTMWVVKFVDAAGEPIALVLNYGVHSVVAGPANTLITGDLAGATERFVERHFDDKAVALWTMGPAGDQNPKYLSDGVQKDPGGKLAYEAMDAQGLVLAVEAIQTANRITQLTSTAHIRAAQSSFSCAVIPPKPRPANAGPAAFAPNSNFKDVIERPTSIPIVLNLIQINQIALTGVSGEIFTRIYWHLRKESPLTNTILVTMSNGRIGYIGDDASYDGPFTNPSVVRGCAESGIVDGLVGLMSQTQ